MGIYDNGLNLNLGEGAGKLAIYAVIAIVVAVIIGAIVLSAGEALKPSALQFRFDKNPIKVGEMTKLYVDVTNVSETDVSDVPLTLEPKEKTEFDVYPLNDKFHGTITDLSKGTSREVSFIINPLGKILPGTYSFVARTTINGMDYEKETVLTVQE